MNHKVMIWWDLFWLSALVCANTAAGIIGLDKIGVMIFSIPQDVSFLRDFVTKKTLYFKKYQKQTKIWLKTPIYSNSVAAESASVSKPATLNPACLFSPLQWCQFGNF